MSNYYEALRKIKASGKLKEPKRKPKIKKTVKETDVPKNERLNQFAINDEDLDRYISTKKDIDRLFDLYLKDKKKIKDKKIVSTKDESYKKTRMDPLAMGETDLLSKYAKEDSLEKARNALKEDSSARKKRMDDLIKQAYEEGFWDPTNREIIFNEMDDIGKERDDIIKMIKGDVSGLTKNPKFANDPKIVEAFEDYLSEKGFPINKIEQLNKNTGSIVSDEPITDREKMLQYLEDLENQTNVDRKFTSKPVDDISAVGGILDETPVEMRGMSQLGRKQMNDDLKNKLVAYRTKKGANTGTDIDDVLLNPYLSTRDLQASERVNKYLIEEVARLRREQGINPDKTVRKLKDVHPGNPKNQRQLRDSLAREKSEIIEEIIKKKYGNVDNLRKNINNDVPMGAEHTVEEANSWLNAYDNALDKEKAWVDFDENRNAESIADLFLDPDTLERKKPTHRSRDYGEETMYLRKKANESRKGNKKFVKKTQKEYGLNLTDSAIDRILWEATTEKKVRELLKAIASKKR